MTRHVGVELADAAGERGQRIRLRQRRRSARPLMGDQECIDGDHHEGAEHADEEGSRHRHRVAGIGPCVDDHADHHSDGGESQHESAAEGRDQPRGNQA